MRERTIADGKVNFVKLSSRLQWLNFRFVPCGQGIWTLFALNRRINAGRETNSDSKASLWPMKTDSAMPSTYCRRSASFFKTALYSAQFTFLVMSVCNSTTSSPRKKECQSGRIIIFKHRSKQATSDSPVHARVIKAAKISQGSLGEHWQAFSIRVLESLSCMKLNGSEWFFYVLFIFCLFPYGISKMCQGTSSMRFSNSWNANPKARRRSTSEIIDFRPVSCDARLKPRKTQKYQKYHIALCLIQIPFYADNQTYPMNVGGTDP